MTAEKEAPELTDAELAEGIVRAQNWKEALKKAGFVVDFDTFMPMWCFAVVLQNEVLYFNAARRFALRFPKVTKLDMASFTWGFNPPQREAMRNVVACLA